MYCSNLLREYPIFTSSRISGLLKAKIHVFIWTFSPFFLIVILLSSVTSCFPNEGSFLLLITPFKVFKPSRGYILLFVMWKLFIFRIFLCFGCPSSQANCHFYFFLLIIWGIVLFEITFSIRNINNLAQQVLLKNSSTIYHGNSLASFFKSDSEIFVFLFEKVIWYSFFTGPVLHHQPWNPTCVENLPRGKPIHLS